MGAVLRYAVPNGRLFEGALELLRRRGVWSGEWTDERMLYQRCGDVVVYRVKPMDVPMYVAAGAADFAIVGGDVLAETMGDATLGEGLGFGRCRLVLAGPRDVQMAKPGGALLVATRYPQWTKRLLRPMYPELQVVVLHGGVELAPAAGIADGIVDVAETGETIRRHDLVETVVLERTEARLVTARELLSASPGRRPLHAAALA